MTESVLVSRCAVPLLQKISQKPCEKGDAEASEKAAVFVLPLIFAFGNFLHSKLHNLNVYFSHKNSLPRNVCLPAIV